MNNSILNSYAFWKGYETGQNISKEIQELEDYLNSLGADIILELDPFILLQAIKIKMK